MKTYNQRKQAKRLRELQALIGLALAGMTLAVPVVVIEVIATAIPTHAELVRSDR